LHQRTKCMCFAWAQTDLANNIRFRSPWRTTRFCQAEAPSATSS